MTPYCSETQDNITPIFAEQQISASPPKCNNGNCGNSADFTMQLSKHHDKPSVLQYFLD
jgi:hypothetical protein